jgi:hypothetical protein
MLDQSKKFVHFGVELLNVGSKVIHKQGVFVVFQLSDEAVALGSLDMNALKAEWPKGELAKNVEVLVAEGKAKLDLQNKSVQEKIVKAVDLLPRGVRLAEGVLSYVSDVKAAFA